MIYFYKNNYSKKKMVEGKVLGKKDSRGRGDSKSGELSTFSYKNCLPQEKCGLPNHAFVVSNGFDN